MKVIEALPKRIVMLDVDALRPDVLQAALAQGKAPGLSRLLGGPEIANGICFDSVSTAPSITYCCQASSFTGAHPRQHWIPGNQYFDRFGRISRGKPRKFEFDFLDTPAVFLKGLAGEAIHPQVETIYETAANHGLVSTVAFNMFAHGAQHWLKPGLDDWRDFTALRQDNFGEKFDDAMINDVLEHLGAGHSPDLLTMYFFGLDHETHIHGPQVQLDYLTRVIDGQMCRFLETYEGLGLMPGTLFVIFSDHGQVSVQNDDLHALKLGFLFDRELGYVFEALGLDVNDHPLEGPNCDALLSPNGGMAHVYLRKPGGHWWEPPRFREDVLPLAEAFWEANQSGKYCQELRDGLEMILVRDVEREGWYADYQAFTPEGPVEMGEFLDQKRLAVVDAAHRLHCLSSPVCGDLLLGSNYAGGYSFSLLPYKGMHGGLHPEDSRAVLAYCLPEGDPGQAAAVCGLLDEAIRARCQDEDGRQVSNADIAYGLRALMGWEVKTMQDLAPDHPTLQGGAEA